MATYYDVLGVAKTAGHDAIKRAYRKVALATHPDRKPGDKAAEARFKVAAKAWETLGDTQKRAQYDQSLSQAGKHQFGSIEEAMETFDTIFGDGDRLGALFGKRKP